MSIIETGFKAANIIIGVDTHKSTHIAVAINERGTRLAAISVPANSKGYMELNNWSRSLGSVQAFSGEKVISLILNCLYLIRRAFYGLARYSATVAAPKQSDRDYPFDTLQVFLIFPALFLLI